MFAYNKSVPYVELHARSAFSFLEGSSLPEDLAARCSQLEQPAMAVTDAHGVYGAPRFHMAAKKCDIRALIGAEVNAPNLIGLPCWLKTVPAIKISAASSLAPNCAM